MCIDPREFRGVQISCRKCWQCKEGRVDDIVGRCIAEQQTSAAAFTVTLTYGGDDRLTGEVNLKARLLDYGDVSRYLKRLRKAVPARYVAAGEYGEQKGRGHWHVILFLAELNEAIPLLNKRVEHKYWPDGWSYWEEATYERMRYACSYVLKEMDRYETDSERRYGASRHPPLGREYFRQLAMKHIEQFLSPQDAFYMFPGIRKKDGQLKRFLLTRRAKEYYCLDFINLWAMAHGNLNWPQSDMIDEFLDRECAARSCRPGDWLEERRFAMNRLWRARRWQGLDDAGVPIGVRVERINRALDPRRLDDRLRVMGNRKGIGYIPSSIDLSPTKSPGQGEFRTRFHPLVEASLGQFGTANPTMGRTAPVPPPLEAKRN